MICLNCGKTIPNIATTCSGCGSNQKEALKELILRVKSGDSFAISTLYEHFKQKGISIAKQYVKTEEDAEDMYQDSFLKALDHIDSFDETKDFGPWLNTIIANTSKNFLAKKKPTNFGDMSDEDREYVDSVENTDSSINPEEALDRKEITKIIDEVMDDLPEVQRQALTMFYYEEMSVSEVAKAQNVSEDTVKSRLRYGRQKAGEAIAKYQKKTGTKLFSLVPVYFIIYFKYIKKITDAASNMEDAADVFDAVDTAANAFDAVDTAADVFDAVDTATDAADAIDTAADAADTASSAADFIDTASSFGNKAKLAKTFGKFAGKQIAKATVYKTAAIATAGVAAAGGGTAVVVKEVQEHSEAATKVEELAEEPVIEGEIIPVTAESDFEWDADGTTIVKYTKNDPYVVLPDKTLAIGPEAFANNAYLERVYFNDNLRQIGEKAFSCCYLLDDVTITERVNTISSNAFRDCRSLKTLTINSNEILTCGYSIFNNTNLNQLTLSDNMTYIPAYLFYDATFFPGTVINIPSNVVYIGSCSFDGINGQDSIYINIEGENLLIIEDNAFYDSDIYGINLPDSLNQISSNAFAWSEGTMFYTSEDSYAHNFIVDKYGQDRLITDNGAALPSVEGTNATTTETTPNIIVDRTITATETNTTDGAESTVNSDESTDGQETESSEGKKITSSENDGITFSNDVTFN